MINFEDFYCEDLGGFCCYNGDCDKCSQSEPEYNLTIQQALQKENIGKYYTSDINDEVILWLTGNVGNLELTVVKDPDLDEEELYCLADEMYNLDFIVNSMYKEVEFKC